MYHPTFSFYKYNHIFYKKLSPIVYNPISPKFKKTKYLF